MIAARTAVDLIVELRYKLRCLGLHVEQWSEIISDTILLL